MKYNILTIYLKISWSNGRLACVPSVSLRFRSKERGTRKKNGANKRAGRGWGRNVRSHSAKLENPVPRSFFGPKPNGIACHAG